MTRERFAEILCEYGIDDEWIERLWNGRHTDALDERKLRITAIWWVRAFGRLLPIIRQQDIAKRN